MRKFRRRSGRSRAWRAEPRRTPAVHGLRSLPVTRATPGRRPLEESFMSTATLTDKDLRVRDAFMQQLEWDPAVDASAIGVSARDGAVALTGTSNTYAGKLAAERAAKRVHGVRAVANDIEVTLTLGRTDADIAADAATMLRMHNEVPDSVQAAVHHGHVTLTGTVDWHYQRLQAEKAVRDIRGVRHVIDHIAVVPRTAGKDM